MLRAEPPRLAGGARPPRRPSPGVPNVSTPKEPDLRKRLVAELKTTFCIFVYLAVFLGAFTTYRRLLLAEYRIPFVQYGYSVLEALVLAKVIVLGRLLRLGERFHDRPLIIPTLYRSLWFGALILAFSVIEHVLVGWLHGEAIGVVVRKALDVGVWEILSRSFVKLLAVLPLIAVGEVDRVLGEGTLFEMFFVGEAGRTGTGPEAAPPGDAAPRAR